MHILHLLTLNFYIAHCTILSSTHHSLTLCYIHFQTSTQANCKKYSIIILRSSAFSAISMRSFTTTNMTSSHTIPFLIIFIHFFQISSHLFQNTIHKILNNQGYIPYPHFKPATLFCLLFSCMLYYSHINF